MLQSVFSQKVVALRIVFASLLALLSQSAMAATVNLQTVNNVVAPSFRGASNTTYYGWETFDDPTAGDNVAPEDEDWVVDDNVTDIGTYVGTLARLRGNNLPFDQGGVDHISSTRNIYTAGSILDETVTAPTSGTLGTGFTTIIVQGVTAFGPFGGDVLYSAINGVLPVSAQTNNAIGSGQFWAKYEIPGNVATYDFTLTSSGENMSLTRVVVDTLWSPSGYASDLAVVPEHRAMGLFAIGSLALGLFRRRS
jgi:hypothetical protein